MSKPKTVYDIDQAGNVICTYVDSESSLRVEKTHVPLAKAALYAFLPAGFPHSVTDDYLSYQLYDSLQAFSSSITNLLANRAVLEGLGVGNSESSPTGALILQIIQDTFSRLATILFAHRMGQAIEPECKFYRFLADVLNDSAQLLDLTTPVLPYFPKMGVLVSAGILRSLCGVSANASKASLSAHFAIRGNLAELNAKEASQETVVSLMGILAGTVVVRMVHDKHVVWMLMLLLVGVHLLMNYSAVRSVKMRSLNRQRATIVFRAWLEHGAILSPAQVAHRESILTAGRGNLTSKSGDYTGFCDFGSYGELRAYSPRGHHRYDFETDAYFLAIWHRRGSFVMRIALKEDGDVVAAASSATLSAAATAPTTPTPVRRGGAASSPIAPLSAWFDAVSHAYHFDSALKDGLQSHYENELPLGSYVSHEQKSSVFAALQGVGWDLEIAALETRTPVRVRVGDGKKGAPEKYTAHAAFAQGSLEAKHD